MLHETGVKIRLNIQYACVYFLIHLTLTILSDVTINNG